MRIIYVNLWGRRRVRNFETWQASMDWLKWHYLQQDAVNNLRKVETMADRVVANLRRDLLELSEI
jgi:hypothetical protein